MIREEWLEARRQLVLVQPPSSINAAPVIRADASDAGHGLGQEKCPPYVQREHRIEIARRDGHERLGPIGAPRLSMTPPAVSKLVARIESRLGVLLFDRSGGGVTLTAEGRAFHEAALHAVEALGATDAAVFSGAAGF